MSEETSEKALTIMAKIKAKEWKEMGKTVEVLREFTDLGGADVILSFIDELKATFQLQITDMLSPLYNELDILINTVIQPLVPLIQDLTNWLLPYMTDLRKMMEGFLDHDLPKWISETQNNINSLKNDINQFFYDMFGGKMGRDIMGAWEGFWTDVGSNWESFWGGLGWG